jgi:hypothetical protein
MFRRFGVFVLLAGTLFGCSSIRQIPIEGNAVSKIEGKELVIVMFDFTLGTHPITTKGPT